MEHRRVWLTAGASMAALLLAAGVYYSYLQWAASTMGVLIGAAVVLVLVLSLAPGEKACWLLPLLGGLALLTIAALGIFLWAACWRRP